MTENRNINSFAENVYQLTKNANIAMGTLVALNDSMTTNSDTVTVTVPSRNSSVGLETFQIPSFANIINQVGTNSNTIATFINGKGLVETTDGTYRQIKPTPVPAAPMVITDVTSPETFNINSNWFFEDFMFPRVNITIDLRDKIDITSDRVLVNRILIDTSIPSNLEYYRDNIAGTTMTYPELLVALQNNAIVYNEDLDTVELPLTTEQFAGTFNVTNINIINGNQWIYLDNLNFGLVSQNGIIIGNSILSINDRLRYKETVFDIVEINTSEMRIRVRSSVGVDNIGIGGTFEYFNEPFVNKNVNIGIGFNEGTIIYLKGINETYNLTSNDWSNPITFHTNDLIYVNNANMTLEQYYPQYIIDYGQRMIAEAKERAIFAYNGLTPNVPVLNNDFFKVVQINTQINASLDIDSVKNTQTQIETTKSNIDSLKSTIAQQKAELITTTDTGQRKKIEQQIATNTSSLAVKQQEYNSLVKYLNTIAYENNAVFTAPKYRIRGFFPIPAPQYPIDASSSQAQNIIAFDIAYRYIKLDNTGTALDTFIYVDPSTGQNVSGVYTDWNISQSAVLRKKFDNVLNVFIWENESVSQGDVVNINQLDIPIQKGEKVEIKVRSISEAGYPLNPLKSEWSNSIIMDFPPNLQTSDQIQNILTDATNEQTNIQLDETLSAVGLYTHLSDSIPNPDSIDNIYYKHEAVNVAYKNTIIDISTGAVSIVTTNVQDILNNILSDKQILTSNIDITSVANNGKTFNVPVMGLLREFARILDASINFNNIIQ